MEEDREDSAPEEVFPIGEDLADQEASPRDDSQGQQEDVTDGEQVQSKEAASEFDPLTANWSRLRDEDVPEQYRPLARMGRTMNQTHSSAMQRVHDLETQLNTQIENVRTLAAQYSRPEAGQRQPHAQEQAPSIEEQTTQLLSRYGFAPGQEGYSEAQIVASMAREIASTIVTQQLQEQLSSVLGGVDLAQLANTVNDLQGGMAGFQNMQVRQAQQRAAAECDEAYDAYGEQVVDAQMDGILVLRGKVVNPATGQPHTVRSAYELLAGITAQQAAEIDAQASSVRKGARRRTAAPPQAPTKDLPNDVGEDLSDDELDAKIAQALNL